MPASSLYDLAKARLIQNINMLDDVGDLPYSFLSPILRHIQNPSQLLQLEDTCPQLRGDTGELWLKFIQRDIPDWEKKPHQPRDPHNWSKVYRKLKKDAEAEKAVQEEKLKERLRALNENRSNRTEIIEGRVGYDPTARAKIRGVGGWGARDPAAPGKTGKAAFDKLRRGIFDQKRAMPKATQMPAHLLQQRKGVVRQAPERLVRMAEAEGPRMMISKGASAGVVSRNSTSGPSATSPQPLPRPTLRKVPASSPDAPQRAVVPQRPSLPADHHFSAPKRALAPPSAAAPLKRKRKEPDLFLAKKRKV